MTKELDVSLTASQAEFLGLTCRYPAYFGGLGCLRGSTKIVTEHGLVAIEDIGHPMLVLSWSEKNNRFEQALSSGAFPKGRANLYRVITQQGEFVANEFHQVFCADYKYRPIHELAVGDSLFVEPSFQQLSSSESYPLELQISVPRYRKTIADLMGNYADECRQYGRQLLKNSKDDQVSVPSRAYAQESYQLYEQTGIEKGLEHSRLGQSFYHASKQDYEHLSEEPGLDEVNLSLECIFEHISQYSLNQQDLQSLVMSLSHQPENQLGNGQIESSSYSCTETSIISIERLESQEVYYDMQVLGNNNYVCETGLIHHNSGKSYIMGLRAVLDVHHSPKAVVGLYSPTHELLTQIAVPIVEYWLQEFGYKPGKDYTVNKNEHTIKTSSPMLGSFLFKSLADLSTIVGYETSSAHVDEIDTLDVDKASLAWSAIDSRNRLNLRDAPAEHKKWSDKHQRMDYINRVCAYSSPEGFKFCWKRWKQEKNDSYQSAKGNTRDNPALSEDYITERTKTMSPEQIKAYIEGEFVNLNSGSVYHAYNRAGCASSEVVRPGETVYIGCDFNVGKTAATVYVRRDGGTVWHAVDEMHGVLDTPELIRIIENRYKSKGHTVVMYPDSTGANRHGTNANVSQIALLQQAGLEVRAKKTNPAVVDRINATNQKFSAGELKVNFDKCPETARCFEQQGYKKNGEPDKDSGTDHQNDASTYPIAYECAIRKTLYKLNFSFAQRGPRQC